MSCPHSYNARGTDAADLGADHCGICLRAEVEELTKQIEAAREHTAEAVAEVEALRGALGILIGDALALRGALERMMEGGACSCDYDETNQELVSVCAMCVGAETLNSLRKWPDASALARKES